MAVELTVVVKDKSGALLEGATVTAVPGDVSAKTAENGEAVLAVDGADRFQITVEAEGDTQTVPFYAVADQSTARLEVNLQYFEQLKKAETVQTQTTESTAAWYASPIAFAGYGVVLVAVIACIVLAVKKAKKSKK